MKTEKVTITVEACERVALHELDAHVAGRYVYWVHKKSGALYPGVACDAALDVFHETVPIKVLDDFVIDATTDPTVIGAWVAHECDGHVYRLDVVQKYKREGYHPRLLSLICNAEWKGTAAAMTVDEEYNVEVDYSAFNDVDDLLAFAKEVAPLLNTDPYTIMRAVS